LVCCEMRTTFTCLVGSGARVASSGLSALTVRCTVIPPAGTAHG
jgi:hypothetical protein